MPILNPKALIEARKKKNWTQRQLSEATAKPTNPTNPTIVISTISRIEKGKSTRVREATLNELATALGVPPKRLCKEPEPERDVMRIRIEPAARNALTLVALRYRIRRESIIEIAPLLFFIAAEQSLQQRRARIAEVSASENAMNGIKCDIRHLPWRFLVDDDVVSGEEQSIKERDLFGEKILENQQEYMGKLDADFDEAEENPFVTFLRESLSKIGSSPETVETVRWANGMWPSYEICTEEAANIVGNDARAARAIVSGDAALHEMPKGSPEQRADWARAELDRKYSSFDLDTLLNSIIPPAADSQTSNSGGAS